MKNKRTYHFTLQLFLVVYIFVFSSCTSTYNFSIETQQPAKFTFPRGISSITVVTNTAEPAIKNFGTHCYEKGKEINTPIELDFDTAFSMCAMSLAQGIKSSDFFSKVSFHKTSLRKDNSSLEIKKINPKIAEQIYELTNTDAIVSVDRCLFNYNQEITKLSTGYTAEPFYTFVNTKTIVDMVCNIYLKNTENPVYSFSLTDTLYYNSQIDNDSLNIYYVIPNVMVREAASYIGEKAVYYIVPSWKRESRFLFTNYESRMKEALVYAKDNKWIEASEIWNSLYGSEKNPLKKARLAYNLAISYEMRDDFDSALELAQTTKILIEINNKKNKEEIQLISKYVTILEERINKNQLLNGQFE